MSNKDYTHIIFILDRSGSMYSIADDAIGGFNALTKSHASLEGQCTMSLVQFDNEIESVYSFVPISDVLDRDKSNYVPRGSTALLDAIGITVVSEGEKLAALNEDERPGLVILAVFTDGEENASTEYNKERIAEIIKHQEDVYKWEVTYLSADPNAMSDAMSYGIASGKISTFNKGNIDAAYDSFLENTQLARSRVSKGLDVDMSYSPEQRKSMSVAKSKL